MDTYDVIVIGGGAAGLNGALLLARSRRSVVVIDAGMPRNAPAAGVHGLLGHDGLPPARTARTWSSRGPSLRRPRGAPATSRRRPVTRDGFVVSLADGRSITARRILVTTGLVDELPDIPGLRERWGRDVLHCPYCHGWEVRDQRIGVLANGPRSVHQALALPSAERPRHLLHERHAAHGRRGRAARRPRHRRDRHADRARSKSRTTDSPECVSTTAR